MKPHLICIQPEAPFPLKDILAIECYFRTNYIRWSKYHYMEFTVLFRTKVSFMQLQKSSQKSQMLIWYSLQSCLHILTNNLINRYSKTSQYGYHELKHFIFQHFLSGYISENSIFIRASKVFCMIRLLTKVCKEFKMVLWKTRIYLKTSYSITNFLYK